MPRRPFTNSEIHRAQAKLADRMISLRNETNLSQDEAAQRAGMTRENWVRLEKSKHLPRLDSLLRIEYALGVDTLDALFEPTTGDLFGRDAPKP
jgi:transcriptional regulator with XRE-family HTH domain